MNAPISATDRRSTTKPPDTRGAVLEKIAINVVAPIALYYALRAAGVDPWLAVTLGVIPPAIRTGWTVATQRRVDTMAIFTMSILALSVAMSFVTGSPRFALAKDGWITGAVGLWICATMLRTPFYFQLSRTMTTGAIHERIELSWLRSPTFRRAMMLATAIWGIGLLADAVVRVVLAYTLPIDQVPLVSGLQYVVVFVLLEVSSQRAVRNSRTRAKVAAEAGFDRP
ncbi:MULTISPECIES: VC0807 family protein [unclassified Nocardia]|uniref:VC0807 family protein n=1 Tax=unclassified Nocardia TaxID=2637762 RepID=UPI001CE3C42A|nr:MULTISPECIES: VC0807 family protein [unclassified Nocardia]